MALNIALSGLFRAFFSKILDMYMPAKKKLNSYMRFIWRIGLIIARYVLPTIFLVKAMMESNEIDKFFILKVCILTSVLFFNVFFDILVYFYANILNLIAKDMKTTNGILSKQSKSTQNLTDLVEDMKQTIIDHFPKKGN